MSSTCSVFLIICKEKLAGRNPGRSAGLSTVTALVTTGAVIVETTSTGTALAVSKVMPYAVAASLIGWMIAYGRRAKREGERLAAAAEAANAAAPPARALETAG